MTNFQLPSGQSVLIDDEDLERVSQRKWYAHTGSKGKVYVQSDEPRVLLHRLLMSAPEGTVVDHRNGNGLDNRKQNLRVCLQGQNVMNSCKKRAHKKYKGVYFDKRRQKWWAQIYANKKAHFLGYVDTEVKAALKYNEAAAQLHGEFAHLLII